MYAHTRGSFSREVERRDMFVMEEEREAVRGRSLEEWCGLGFCSNSFLPTFSAYAIRWVHSGDLLCSKVQLEILVKSMWTVWATNSKSATRPFQYALCIKFGANTAWVLVQDIYYVPLSSWVHVPISSPGGHRDRKCVCSPPPKSHSLYCYPTCASPDNNKDNKTSSI